MTLQDIKTRLVSNAIFHSEEEIRERPTVIGYEKKFRLLWMATQLNTFIVASDYADEPVTVKAIESLLTESFEFAKTHYRGWPRGLQSALGVIAILLSSKIEENAIDYCRKLKSGKKWAGLSIPVTLDTKSQQVYSFEKNPIWGRIYYPHFKRLIAKLTQPEA